ncbi:unnamed protein product [Ceratitis capitata]|uniref:(Mediterranean fruit fly) hypothetical protein n=1 Tax=Ceratitis capitata TaxID=7213 RepID=A0A811UV48_CERCA|nr:unnamed protein product [Ceratitis capitata]
MSNTNYFKLNKNFPQNTTSSLKVHDSALKAIRPYLCSSKDDALSVDVEIVTNYLQLLEKQWARFCGAQQEVELSCAEDSLEMEED